MHRSNPLRCRSSALTLGGLAPRNRSRGEGKNIVGGIDIPVPITPLAVNQNLDATVVKERTPSLLRNPLPPHLLAHMVEVGAHAAEGKQDTAGTELQIAKTLHGYPTLFFWKIGT